MSHRTLRIEFTQPIGKRFPILSYGIRAIQQTEYSHVRLRWTNSTGKDIIYEASGNHVKFVGTLAQKDHKVKIIKYYELDLDTTHYRGLIDLCMEYAGVEYGKLQIVGILLATIFKLDRNPLANGKYSQVCSELVGRFLEEVMGYNLDINLDIAGPKQIDEFLFRKHLEGLVRMSQAVI